MTTLSIRSLSNLSPFPFRKCRWNCRGGDA
jgi:hypothetical protein